MRPDELDLRAYRASEAARTSVLRLANASPPVWQKGRHRVRSLVTAGVACSVVIAAVALLTVSRGSDTTSVSTDLAATGNPSELPPPPPIPPSRFIGDGISVITTGTAPDGRVWSLYLSGPDANLCLSVELPGVNVEPGMCASTPGGGSLGNDEYRPLFFNDTRAPAFVFGRMPLGVEDVTVDSRSGDVVGRAPVISTSAGLFYVVQVDDGVTPVAVLGRSAQGAPVRYELSLGAVRGRDYSAFWFVAGLGLLVGVTAYRRRRSRGAR